MLDCEMAATTDLDTNMNFVTKSMNGIMKISGRDVVLEESPEFRKLAKLLMFKNKKMGKVSDMSVSGLISDNKLEVFPFVLKIDRYTLAMSGLQNFDQSFKYHVSVLADSVPLRNKHLRKLRQLEVPYRQGSVQEYQGACIHGADRYAADEPCQFHPQYLYEGC